MKRKNILKMGVINITPDSFSDGGEFNSLASLKSKIERTQEWAGIIDFGAESTAPFNDGISAVEEIARYEKLLYPYVESHVDPESIISIDTYKVDVFDSVASKIQERWPKTEIIFNDISGKLDDKLLNYLRTSPLKFDYILCHNLCPTRAESSNHMDYSDDSLDIVNLVNEFFKTSLEALSDIDREIMIDPCFGFSKTRSQNHELLKNMELVLEDIPIGVSCVYGVSRKSFLRFPIEMNAKTLESRERLDHLQIILVKDLLSKIPERKFIIRTHNSSLFWALDNYIDNFS